MLHPATFRNIRPLLRVAPHAASDWPESVGTRFVAGRLRIERAVRTTQTSNNEVAKLSDRMNRSL